MSIYHRALPVVISSESGNEPVDVEQMRRYIRHPACVPLTFSVEDVKGHQDTRRAFSLRDVSEGGLCFSSEKPLEPGSDITIEIPVGTPPFRAQGVVAWCRPEQGHYAVGVQFDDQVTRYTVRMVEQVCHIEHYRADVREVEGRELTSEEAAREWIDRYAKDFPGHYG